MTENNRQHDIELISNVIEVRTVAITIAASTKNVKLYAAAVANDDQAILEILEDMVSETETELAEKDALFETSATLAEHLHTLALKHQDAERLDLLVELRDMAKANVELLTSGEVCYPPAYKSTEELLENLKVLEEAEDAVAAAQAG